MPFIAHYRYIVCHSLMPLDSLRTLCYVISTILTLLIFKNVVHKIQTERSTKDQQKWHREWGDDR